MGNPEPEPKYTTVFHCLSFVYFEIIQTQNRRPNNKNRESHRKATKLKSKFYLSPGLFDSEQRGPGATLLGWPKSIYYGKDKETHELIFSWLSWLAVLLVGAYARRRRSRATWRPYSKCNRPWFTVNLFDIGHPCYDQLTPVKVSADQYHVTISRAQV